MKKNDKLYYFKFDTSLWLSIDSKVQLLSHEQKGIFIDLCAMCLKSHGYINNDKNLCSYLKISHDKLSDILKVFSEDVKIITINNDKISISFILEQINDMTRIHEAKVKGGRKGGKKNEAKIKDTLSIPSVELDKNEASFLKEKEILNNNININKEMPITKLVGNCPNNLSEIIEEASKICFKMSKEDAEKFMAYYDAMDWTIKGMPIRKWQSLLVTWKINHHEYKTKEDDSKYDKQRQHIHWSEKNKRIMEPGEYLDDGRQVISF